ncbi:MAG: sulfite exporter TauE/SafE family protein [Rubrivivax sp.]|nr:sulfite exporter TauE/SafE family protein [Rubrivivax sp.]
MHSDVLALAPWLLAYAATGAFIGFLAGLLGIGGGMTLVPVLAAMFTAQQLAPGHTVHLALGTGMASILFTSTASVREHHRLGGVDWAIVQRLGPGMVAGTLMATALSGYVPQRALALAFAVIVCAGATQIWLGRKPSAARTLPGTPALVAVGLAIGVVCGVVAAGGAFLTVPFMLFCGVPMINAIGTGAALGLPVALIGTLGYVWSGSGVPGLPQLAVGFVHVPALLALVAGSVITAPLGARAAHRLPVATLKRVFAGLLYVLAAKMLFTYW